MLKKPTAQPSNAYRIRREYEGTICCMTLLFNRTRALRQVFYLFHTNLLENADRSKEQLQVIIVDYLAYETLNIPKAMLGEKLSTMCQQGMAPRTWELTPRRVTRRWESSLTGWTSCETPNSITRAFDFPSSESAIAYCERNGLPYTQLRVNSFSRRAGSTVISGALRKEVNPKSYGDNFSVQRRGIPIWPL